MLKCGASRVVRRTEQDRPGSWSDRPPHRVKIMNSARTEWHRYRGRTSHWYCDRISLEAAPRVDHLITGLAGGLQQVVEHRHRAGAESELLCSDAKVTADFPSQLCVGNVGVTVHLGHYRGSGFDDARERGERVLVAGQLEGGPVAHLWRRFSSLVRRQSRDGGANLDQIRTSPRGVLKIAAARPGRSRGEHQPMSTSAKISLLRPPSHSSTRAGSPAISILSSSTSRPPAEG